MGSAQSAPIAPPPSLIFEPIVSSTTALPRHPSTKYRSLGLVGQGQFGQVYCAIHRKTGRLVALKNLNRDRFATHQFLRELRFLLSLDHPHIANCLTLDQSGKGRQLVLDYCEGGTLRDIMEQGVKLTLTEILALIIEVLSALEHAHQKNIIHCDIKPENILLTLSLSGWQAKVSDFGIARLSQEFQQDHSGATGSPAYMAPERFYFQSSAASDLYAVGIVLYELLLGDRPFSGNYNQLMVCHLNHIVKLPDTLPSSLHLILKKAMEKLKPRRFRSAAEMRAALIAAQATLTPAQLSDRYPQGGITEVHSLVVPPPPEALPAACTALSVLTETAVPQLLAACGQTLYQWSLTASQQIDPSLAPQTWQFDAPITQLSKTTTGTIVVTGSQLHQLTATGIEPLATFEDAIALLPGSQRWAFGQTLTSPRRLWLVDTTQQVTPVTRELPSPGEAATTHLVALDDRHYVTATVDATQSTLQVLTRKGQLLGKLRIQVPIARLFASSKPTSFMALAGSQEQDFLVVTLQPYRILRCRLDITAQWLGELVTGYVAISQTGKMRFVNYQGQLIGQVDGLPPPSAIAFQPPHQIWLATVQPEKSHLHCIDIRELGLDIIF